LKREKSSSRNRNVHASNDINNKQKVTEEAKSIGYSHGTTSEDRDDDDHQHDGDKDEESSSEKENHRSFYRLCFSIVVLCVCSLLVVYFTRSGLVSDRPELFFTGEQRSSYV